MGFRVPGVTFPVRQVAIAASLAVFALVALSFGRVVIAEYRLQSQKQALESDVSQLKQQNQQLRSEIDYLNTDPAIEQLAREELGWTKPGDTAVIVLETAAPTPVAAPVQPGNGANAATPARQWWTAILDRIGLNR